MSRKYLSQRFPVGDNPWKIILPISIFIGLFMIIFQPFGLNGLEMDYKPLVLSGYGLVTFIILIFNLLLLPILLSRVFDEERWTVLKELIFYVWILFTIGLGNLFYTAFFLELKLSLTSVLTYQGYTLAVGIIPIAVLVIIKQSYLKRKNVESAQNISSSLNQSPPNIQTDEKIKILSDSGKESIKISVQDFLFVKSDGNYITVGYLKDGRQIRTLLRNTMKYASDLLAPYPFMFQCHRSWLVNINNISKVNGNSQGLRIEIKGMEDDIPVARNQMAEFKEKITKNRS